MQAIDILCKCSLTLQSYTLTHDAMTAARCAPVFVASAPARFGHSVWDAVGSTGQRGFFYDEQAHLLR